MGQGRDLRQGTHVDHRCRGHTAESRARAGRGLLILAWLLVGCSADRTPEEAPPAPPPDFGDAVVVENGPPPGEPTWSVDSLPLWSIGQAEGDSLGIFSRITGVVPVGEGGFAVLDATPATIRIYDADGARTGILGGRDGRPGALELPATLLPGGGDTLVVHDVSLRRRMWFHPGSGFLGEEPLELEGGTVLGRLPTGERIIRRDSDLPRPLPVGLVERRVVFRLEDPAGDGVELGDFPGIPLVVHDAGGGRTPEVTPLPFHAAPLATPWGERVVVSDGTADLREYDRSGALVRVIRTGIVPEPVTPAWTGEFLRSRTSGIPDPEVRARVRDDLAEVSLPAAVPLFADLKVDARGNLWLLATRLPGEPPLQRWWVVDADGRVLGDVRMPPRVSLRIPGDEAVLGSVADDTGVVRVVRHRLRK